MKVLLEQNSWAPVTVEFVVVENSHTCINKFEVTEKNASGVANLQKFLAKSVLFHIPLRYSMQKSEHVNLSFVSRKTALH